MADHGVVISAEGLQPRQGPPRAPKQRNTLGVAGYKKPVTLYDPYHPELTYVQEEPIFDPTPRSEAVVALPPTRSRVRVLEERPDIQEALPPELKKKKRSEPPVKRQKTSAEVNAEKNARRKARKEKERAAADPGPS